METTLKNTVTLSRTSKFATWSFTLFTALSPLHSVAIDNDPSLVTSPDDVTDVDVMPGDATGNDVMFGGDTRDDMDDGYIPGDDVICDDVTFSSVQSLECSDACTITAIEEPMSTILRSRKTANCTRRP